MSRGYASSLWVVRGRRGQVVKVSFLERGRRCKLYLSLISFHPALTVIGILACESQNAFHSQGRRDLSPYRTVFLASWELPTDWASSTLSLSISGREDGKRNAQNDHENELILSPASGHGRWWWWRQWMKESQSHSDPDWKWNLPIILKNLSYTHHQ